MSVCCVYLGKGQCAAEEGMDRILVTCTVQCLVGGNFVGTFVKGTQLQMIIPLSNFFQSHKHST